MENRLMEILGKQRTYTQIIAKDASRISVLLQARDSEDRVQSPDTIHSRIAATKSDLLNARDQFSSVLNQIQKGYILDGSSRIPFDNTDPEIKRNLKRIQEIWNHFSKSVDVISRADNVDAEFRDAIIYIDEKNEMLLDSCDKLLNAGIDITKQQAGGNTLIIVIITAVAFIVFGISLLGLYRYFVDPLMEIYKGFSEFGVTSDSFNHVILVKNEFRPLIDEVKNLFRKMDTLFSLIENMNSNSSFGEVLEYIFTSFAPFIPYNYIGIALLKNNESCLEASYGISDGTVRGLPEAMFNRQYAISETSLEQVLDTGHVRVINDLESYNRSKPIKEYTQIIIDAGIKSSITLPLNRDNKHIGIIFFSSRYVNAYDEKHVKFLKAIANSIAISFDKNIFIDDLLYSSLIALTKLAEARDEDTGLHLERMKIYSRAIAQFLYSESNYKNRITPEFINDIEKFSPMHDIGKVGVSDGILLKPGKLTFDEFEEMKKHTVFGATVLRTAEEYIQRSGRSIFTMGIEIAECHHEKWDGSGYPFGKRGEDIPLSARIVAVADVFDALTSKRPYKEPFPFDKSFEIIIEGSGKHFDPEIARVFEKNKQAIFDLYSGFNAIDPIDP